MLQIFDEPRLVAADAHRVVLAGFVTGIVCSFAGRQIKLQGDGYGYPGVAFQAAIGPSLAFLVAQMTEISVFN